jgi:hypothetical protein
MDESKATVRYKIDDVSVAIAFYTGFNSATKSFLASEDRKSSSMIPLEIR